MDHDASSASRMDPERERALVARSRLDASAFGELYDFYLPRIFGFVIRRVGDRTVAEDLTAMTFERALGIVRRQEFRNESFGGWQLRPALHPVAWGPSAAARAAATATFERGPSFTRRWYRRRSRPYPWLTSAGQDAVDLALSRDEIEPLGWRDYLGWSFARTAWQVAQRTLDAVGDTAGCRIAHPLAEPTLLSSLTHAWPRRGPADRTDVMRAVVGDLLPTHIVEREDKAILASVFIGPASRAFIERWNGSGVDSEWVDTTALREVWARQYPYAGSFNLLHQAWLASQA